MSVEENKVERTAMGGQGKQITEHKGGSRGLSWIRPQMMHHVLSSINEEKMAAHSPTQLELLKLFPESRTRVANDVTDRKSVSESCSEKQSSAELTIFYNGAVKVYHVSADMAQAVIKLAHSIELSEKATLKPSKSENEVSRAGLDMARKLSLQRFLQKRKERVETLNPYASTGYKPRSKVWAEEGGDEYEQISLSLSLPSQRCE